jgi:hypothetical protein
VDQHLCRGFASGVGVSRSEDALFGQVVAVFRNLAVDFIGGDVNETAKEAVVLGALEEDVGAIDIGGGELVGVSEGEVHVGLRREVEDSVDFVFPQSSFDLVRRGYVAMHKGEVVAGAQRTGVVERCTVVELVERHDVIAPWIGGG